MLNILKTVNNALIEIDEIEHGAWINIENPTNEELERIHKALNVDMDFLRAPLDDEESSRLETEDGTSLILVDIPIVEEENESRVYDTIPLGIILTDHNIITVTLKSSPIIQQFKDSKVKTFYTNKKIRFLLQLLYRIDVRYLMYLKQIDKMSSAIEKQLHKSMKNKELIQLLALEKSLVYFSTSLKGNEIVLEKLLKMAIVTKYPEDQDLLEDVIIENKQAIEMASIYSNILSGMMDAFASVISNNLNIVMKILTSITIVLSIPTMVASFFGMNVNLPMQNNPYAYLVILGISMFGSIMAVVFLKKKNML